MEGKMDWKRDVEGGCVSGEGRTYGLRERGCCARVFSEHVCAARDRERACVCARTITCLCHASAAASAGLAAARAECAQHESLSVSAWKAKSCAESDEEKDTAAAARACAAGGRGGGERLGEGKCHPLNTSSVWKRERTEGASGVRRNTGGGNGRRGGLQSDTIETGASVLEAGKRSMQGR
eukprot:3154528-Rhodomonas_salina.1